MGYCIICGHETKVEDSRLCEYHADWAKTLDVKADEPFKFETMPLSAGK